MNKRKLLMKKNSWIIFLLLFGIMGCTTSQRNKQKQEDVARKDTAYVIKSFLREGITYIPKIRKKQNYSV